MHYEPKLEIVGLAHIHDTDRPHDSTFDMASTSVP